MTWTEAAVLAAIVAGALIIAGVLMRVADRLARRRGEDR